MVSKKIKTLALVLRSLPEGAQRSIYERLPIATVERIAAVDPNIQETLSESDWNNFIASWPEFAEMIHSARDDGSKLKLSTMLARERSRVREYLEYKQGSKRDRPKLSSAITSVIDKFVGV